MFDRKNAPPVPRRHMYLLTPSETSAKGNYISKVVKGKYYDYYNMDHRYAVCKLDSIARKLTYKWAKRVTTKTFKFYSSHEVDAKEVMEDIRAKWVELNCNEILKKGITPLVRDGFILLTLEKDDEEIDYNVYGEFECPPKLWTRDTENNITGYKIQYTPRPRAIPTNTAGVIIGAGNDNLRAVSDDLTVEDVIHIEYGEPNSGLGDPLIEGAWDCIMKLIGESHQEMLDKRSIPTLHLTEDDHDEDHTKAKELLGMIANSDQDVARVWYHDKNAVGEVSEFPKFAYESPTSNPEYNNRQTQQGISTGDFGNVSKEWTRLTTITGHTINYFMGNRAGATVGSETDKSSDDEQEIEDFGLLENFIRKILEWLAANDIIKMPKDPFVIKYWKDWESIERIAKIKEEVSEQMAGKMTAAGQLPDKTKEIDSQDNDPKNEKENKINVAISNAILSCMRKNLSYPMSDVLSSWIAKIGYDDLTDRVFMELLSGIVYSKPAPMGEWTYLDWDDYASKGRYFWDYLSQRDPPWQRDSIPSHLNEDSVETKENYEIVKIPILDFPLINKLDTETKIKRLGRQQDWSMGTGTASKIKRMLSSLKDTANKHQLRVNTMSAQAFGNSIKEKHPLMYDIGDGVVVEEYICPISWKNNVGKIVPLGVYHNVDSFNDPELPDWQVVGNAEIFGWDDETGEDFVKYDYDYDRINEVFKVLDQYDWLTAALKENGTSDISTAYYCDIEHRWSDSMGKVIRVQVNIELVSISFVPRGNCPGEICSLVEVKRNIDEMQSYIKTCIADGEAKADCLALAYKRFKAKT